MFPKRLFLVDGSELAYRAYFAFIRNPLVSSKGEETSAVFGFTNSLMKLLREERPECLAVVFDTSKPTFRHRQYKEYKATREKMPAEMASQFGRIRQVIDALNLPVLELEGFEADDIIGTLACRAARRGFQVIIYSGDKDMLQLVTDEVLVMRPGRKGEETVMVDRAGVLDRFGVEPSKVTDVLGLMGDTSDNVPGVPGVGQKTAVKLVQDFGDLESILENIDRIPLKRVRENLGLHAEDARLSKELVTIQVEVPLEVEPEDLVVREPKADDLVSIFKELEFSSFLKEIAPTRPSYAVDYQTVDDEEGLVTLLHELRLRGEFAIDVETTSTEPMRAQLVGISICCQEGRAFYLPLAHRDGKNLDFELVRRELGPVLRDEGINKCGQNIKYDEMVLERHDLTLRGIAFDTMVASYLLNPSALQHNLELLSLKHLNHKMIPINTLIGSGGKAITFDKVPIPQATAYAAEDADMAWRLKAVFEPRLRTLELMPLFSRVEMPLISVLSTMERNGVAVDTDFLGEMSRGMEGDLLCLTEEIYQMAGEEFNINSTKQLATILFEKLGLPTVRRTKTGYSTDMSVLEALAPRHQIVQKLVDYRQLMKLKSTYVDALPGLINPDTGRIHTSFNQTVTATGRLSSSDPNLQNIPMRTELGREIRKAFTPGGRNWLILSADYSQIELRIMAHLSNDQTLIDSFLKGEDVHRRTASLIFGLPVDQVSSEFRAQAKVVNFGIIYGMGAYGLSSRLGLSMDEAKAFIGEYFQRYPGVKAYMDETIEQARRNGYVTTMLNRRRYLPEITSTNGQSRAFAERTAINTPIQGTAADLIKLAMIDIHHELQRRGMRTKMIIQIHDELVFEVPEDELTEASQMVREKMEGAISLQVPIVVEVGYGKSWFDAH